MQEEITLKVPPCAVEVEKHVIGGLLLGQEDAYQAFDVLKAEDFYVPKHAHLFGALSDMRRAGRVLDPVTVSEVLKARGTYEKAGGDYYLIEIMTEVVSAAGMADYCAIVLDKAERRRLIQSYERGLQEAWDQAIPTAEVRRNSEARLLDDGARDAQAGPVSAKEALISTLPLIEKVHSGELQGLQTQFPVFNQQTGGLCAPDWIVLAGRPAVGKTALALDLVDYIATDCQKHVLFFSLEMPKEQLMQRLICRRQGVDFQAMRTGRMGGRDWERMALAVEELKSSRLHIDDSPDQTPGSILSKCRRFKARVGAPVSLVVVDNLSIMDSDGKHGERFAAVTEITRELKKNCKRLGVPILTLVHFSRALEARGEDAIPRMADLRECGTIEQDADVVFGLHRPDPQGTRVDIHAIKQRNGPAGVVIPLTAEFQYQRFKSYDAAAGFLHGLPVGPSH